MKIISLFLFFLPALASPAGTYYKFEPIGTDNPYSVEIATEGVTPVGVGADGATTYLHSAVITGINQVFPAGATGRITTRQIDTTVTVVETQVMDATHYHASASIFLPLIIASASPQYGVLDCSLDVEASSAVCSGEYPMYTGRLQGNPDAAVGTTTFVNTQNLIPFATFEDSQATPTSPGATIPIVTSPGATTSPSDPTPTNTARALLPLTSVAMIVLGTMTAMLL